MAQVIVSPRAKRDVDEAVSRLSLPTDTWSRIVRSLRVLETVPLSGPELEGRWAPVRFVLGPWSWMLLLGMTLVQRHHGPLATRKTIGFQPGALIGCEL